MHREGGIVSLGSHDGLSGCNQFQSHQQTKHDSNSEPGHHGVEIEQGNPLATEQLWAVVYEEMRKLATARLSQEKPGQTLQATALVHDAYIRLVDVDKAQHWNSRGHFFGAAAEAMRRILVEAARRRARLRHGGDRERIELDDPTADALGCDSFPACCP